MPVTKNTARPLVYAAMATFLLAGSSLAQTKQDAVPKDDKVVAIVNGHEIKVSEVEMAAEDILGQLPDVPPQLRYPYIVEYLVERHLLAQAAVKDGVAESEEYKRRLALYQAKALRDAYYAEKIKPTVTEEEIKAAYDTESAKVAQTERVRARHILVQTEAEAQQIIEKLNAGEKFADVAKKYSLDGSKEYGGDLGYFTAAEMVPEFSKAAFALKVGELSAPVKTDFGWHIILLEDRKMGGAQPYDQVKVAIGNVLLRKKTQEKIIALRKAAKIELKDPDLVKFQEEAMKLQQKARDKAKGAGRAAGEQTPAAGDAPLEPEASSTYGRKIGYGRTAIGGALIGGRGMAGHSRSPLAPEALAQLPAIAGVSLATAETGIRYKNRPDFLLVELAPGATVAGVFTTSKSRSAPVDWCAASLKAGDARALVVNAGNANAFTGKAGVKTVTEVAGAAAKLFDAKPKQIFQASTGVIGEPLDPAPLIKAMADAKARLGADAWADAARAIMTTDTFAKAATVKARIGRSTVTINGIAKGSGMIAPDMATMLVFLFTDAKLPARVLQKLLSASTAKSFQLHHGRRRHIDLGYGSAFCLRRRRGSLARHSRRERSAAQGLCQGARCLVPRSCASGRQGRRGCREIHRDRDHGR